MIIIIWEHTQHQYPHIYSMYVFTNLYCYPIWFCFWFLLLVILVICVSGDTCIIQLDLHILMQSSLFSLKVGSSSTSSTISCINRSYMIIETCLFTLLYLRYSLGSVEGIITIHIIVFVATSYLTFLLFAPYMKKSSWLVFIFLPIVAQNIYR